VSADNWAKCPRCIHAARADLNEKQRQVDAAYGKVSVAEFDQARADLADGWKSFEGYDAYRTFREDYEIHGAEDGEVRVGYHGGCKECGLTLTFEHVHPLDVDGTS
jgi:hypothetical protein